MSTALARRRDDDELRALARLGGEEIGGAVGGIQALHRTIADRAFGATGPGATPARVMHDAISSAVYGGLRGAARLGGAGLGAVAAGRGRALSEHPRGAAVVAAIDGLIGDVLERDESPLAEPMAVRVAGRIVPPEPAALRDAFPQATPRLAVFVHGLMETEHAWALGGREPYGERLARDLGLTPVYVRANTGRRISHNGASLAELLESVVDGWPVQVESLALVGHSMGGLIARSACHHATRDGRAWVGLVRHVVCLGSPHMGAPLEQAVHVLAAGLDRVPEARGIARFLRRRSGGIRDLHGGSLVDEDWRDRDAEALRREAIAEVPLLEGAAHHFVSACITRRPGHPAGRVIGDLLVLQASASGRSRRRRLAFREEDGIHLDGASHFALLNHPAIADALVGWLSRTPAA